MCPVSEGCIIITFIVRFPMGRYNVYINNYNLSTVRSRFQFF